jgi:hypothetical protein
MLLVVCRSSRRWSARFLVQPATVVWSWRLYRPVYTLPVCPSHTSLRGDLRLAWAPSPQASATNPEAKALRKLHKLAARLEVPGRSPADQARRRLKYQKLLMKVANAAENGLNIGRSGLGGYGLPAPKGEAAADGAHPARTPTPAAVPVPSGAYGEQGAPHVSRTKGWPDLAYGGQRFLLCPGTPLLVRDRVRPPQRVFHHPSAGLGTIARMSARSHTAG